MAYLLPAQVLAQHPGTALQKTIWTSAMKLETVKDVKYTWSNNGRVYVRDVISDNSRNQNWIILWVVIKTQSIDIF